MKIKTYVINLKDAADRKNAVLAELSEYPFMNPEIVEAVDGRKMSPKEVSERFDVRKFQDIWARDATPGEIGCTLSHRECYRRFLESTEEIVLIIEDDVRFLAGEKTVYSLFQEMIGQMSDKPCVATFTRHTIYYTKGAYQVGEYSFCRVREAWGTCAYLINRNAAEVLLRKIPVPYSVADDYRDMDKKGIKIMSIYPMLAIGKSDIGEVFSSIPGRGREDSSMKSSLSYWFRTNWERRLRSFLIHINYLKQRKDPMRIVDTRNS